MAESFRALGVVQAFNLRSDFAKIMYGNMLQVLDPRTANFFQRHGMVTKTSLDQDCDTPIQCIDDFERGRIDELTVYIQTFMGGVPMVGARTPAADDGQAIPQTTFKFKTVDMFSPPLALPTAHEENVVPVSIFMNYGKHLRTFWERVIENTIWIVATGMRGAATNWAALEPIQQGQNTNAGHIANSATSSFTEYMTKLHEVNPITSPSDKFSTWGTGNANSPREGGTIDPAGATAVADSNLTLSDISAVGTYLDTRTEERRNIGFHKPMLNVLRKMGEGSSQSDGMHEWLWIIAPEVADAVRKGATADNLATWGSYQIARTEGGQLNNGYDNSFIGRLFGISFATFDGLPRYWGGSTGTVPICRTMIFGRQAVAYGFRRNLDIGRRYTAQFNPQNRSMNYNGINFRTWVHPQNQGQYSILKSACDFGVRKVRYKDFYNQSKEIDRGVMSIDIPYTSLETTGL